MPFVIVDVCVWKDSLAASERTSRTPRSTSTGSVSSSTSGWSTSALSPGYSHATRLDLHLLEKDAFIYPFNNFTLLFGRQKGHPACKTLALTTLSRNNMIILSRLWRRPGMRDECRHGNCFQVTSVGTRRNWSGWCRCGKKSKRVSVGEWKFLQVTGGWGHAGVYCNNTFAIMFFFADADKSQNELWRK